MKASLPFSSKRIDQLSDDYLRGVKDYALARDEWSVSGPIDKELSRRAELNARINCGEISALRWLHRGQKITELTEEELRDVLTLATHLSENHLDRITVSLGDVKAVRDELARRAAGSSVVARMPFGKHRGKPIASLHENYLRGVLKISDLDALLRRAIESELARREATDNPQTADESPATIGQLNLLRRFGLPEVSTYSEAVKGIAEINRRLTGVQMFVVCT